MIRNYNGNVNRSVLRKLKELSSVIAENEKNLMETFAKNGEVSFYENLGFFGLPDELSEIKTLKSEEEIKEYLKKDVESRIKRCLKKYNADDDYLLKSVVEFIKTNSRYPIKEELKTLECEAEAKRIAELPPEEKETKKITTQNVMEEILELAEEIMESRRETNPDDISQHVEPYPDELGLQNDDFRLNIQFDRYYGHDNSCDYSLKVLTRKCNVADLISFQRWANGKVFFDVAAGRGEKISLPMGLLFKIHKCIVELAEKEGIEFTSEIDYENVVKE